MGQLSGCKYTFQGVCVVVVVVGVMGGGGGGKLGRWGRVIVREKGREGSREVAWWEDAKIPRWKLIGPEIRATHLPWWHWGRIQSTCALDIRLCWSRTWPRNCSILLSSLFSAWCSRFETQHRCKATWWCWPVMPGDARRTGRSRIHGAPVRSGIRTLVMGRFRCCRTKCRPRHAHPLWRCDGSQGCHWARPSC